MREIEFRGKQLYEIHETAKTFASPKGTWHFGSYCYAHKYSDGESGYLICDIYGRPTMCDRNTIGQFTGLFDKNGKRIYEGDIIRDTHFYKPCAVEWLGNGWWLDEDGRRSMPEPQYREIIGTIHENPELLGANK